MFVVLLFHYDHINGRVSVNMSIPSSIATNRLTHGNLLNLANLLEYNLGNSGLCQGFSGMWMQAVLAGEEEELHFFERLAFIESYKPDFTQLKKEIDDAFDVIKKLSNDITEIEKQLLNNSLESSVVSELQNKLPILGIVRNIILERYRILFEIPTFFDGVKLYLEPWNDKGRAVFSKILNQQDIQVILSFTQSKQLKANFVNDYSVLTPSPYTLTAPELVGYFGRLTKVLPNVPILFSSENHSVCLRYNTKQACWRYIDTNNFGTTASYYQELSTENLVSAIFKSFDNKKYIAFFIQAVVPGQGAHLDSLQAQLDQMPYPVKEQVSRITETNRNSLYFACMLGKINTVQKLLDAGAQVNQPITNNGISLLYIAAQHGHLNIVRTLLDKGANTNQLKTSGASPLYIAAQNEHIDIVKALLAKGAEANQATSDGATPLFIAAQNGNFEIAMALLAKGAQVNQTRTIDGASPLFIAVQNGHLNVVKALLDKGANANHLMTSGASPLYIAAQHGHIDIGMALLARDAKISQPRTIAPSRPSGDTIG